jgi:hypothetical protein
LPAFGGIIVVEFGHSGRCVVLVIYIFSLVKCLLRFIGPFLIKFLIFLFFSLQSFGYILDTSPLSDTCFANIFS